MREREQSADALALLLLWLVTQAPPRTFIRLYADGNVSINEEQKRWWTIHNSTPAEAVSTIGAAGNANTIAPQAAQLVRDFHCISHCIRQQYRHAIPTLDVFGDYSAELETDCDRGTHNIGSQRSWAALAAQLTRIRV